MDLLLRIKLTELMRIKKIDYLEIINTFHLNIHLDWLRNEYLADRNGRHDIFEKLDIFYDNVRSINRVDKDFSLFEYTDDIDGSVIVIGLYLELLEYWGEFDKIGGIIKHYSEKYPNNKVVFYWNHDTDFKKYNHFVESCQNVYIINYNTSHESRGDIVTPFWSFDVVDINVEKDRFCSFVGSPNNEMRSTLINTVKDKSNYYILNKLNKDEYAKAIGRSIFNLSPRGQGLSSYRFFECLYYDSIPVLIADDVVLPFKNEVDYNDICIRIPEGKCGDFQYINNTLLNVDHGKMIYNISQIKGRFNLKGIQKNLVDRLW